MRLFLILLGAAYLGGLSAYLGYTVIAWQYWAICTPYFIATAFIPSKPGRLL